MRSLQPQTWDDTLLTDNNRNPNSIHGSSFVSQMANKSISNFLKKKLLAALDA
jgi:hypothetical protein